MRSVGLRKGTDPLRLPLCKSLSILFATLSYRRQIYEREFTTLTNISSRRDLCELKRDPALQKFAVNLWAILKWSLKCLSTTVLRRILLVIWRYIWWFIAQLYWTYLRTKANHSEINSRWNVRSMSFMCYPLDKLQLYPQKKNYF